MENTASRLNKIMNDRNLKQVDIIKLAEPYCKKYNVKLGKNDLSQYLSGKVEPGQKKLAILGMALKVSPTWLMGINDELDLEDGTIDMMISDDMGTKYISNTQLSVITGIPSEEIRDIADGKEKLPKPSSLMKIADALGENLYDYLIGAGYIEDPENSENKLFDSGIRYLLPREERDIICNYLADIWNKNSRHTFTSKEIYNNLFIKEKEEYSTDEVLNMINNELNIINNTISNDSSINNKCLDNREILFNKAKDILSDDDWATIEFIMNKTINNYEKNKKEE